MCVAVPAEVVALKPDDVAIVNIGGIEKDISVALLDDVGVGDYVIIHMGHALNKMDVREARTTLQLMADIGMRVAVPPERVS